mmetsp:Transcript_29434/g.85631  ORF Transcript_29434/g.85631 Transcript_29434/m.85631 type:complete len:205 (-) Transcript_29434:3679-4293(-)
MGRPSTSKPTSFASSPRTGSTPTASPPSIPRRWYCQRGGRPAACPRVRPTMAIRSAFRPLAFQVTGCSVQERRWPVPGSTRHPTSSAWPRPTTCVGVRRCSSKRPPRATSCGIASNTSSSNASIRMPTPSRSGDSSTDHRPPESSRPVPPSSSRCRGTIAIASPTRTSSSTSARTVLSMLMAKPPWTSSSRIWSALFGRVGRWI